MIEFKKSVKKDKNQVITFGANTSLRDPSEIEVRPRKGDQFTENDNAFDIWLSEKHMEAHLEHVRRILPQVGVISDSFPLQLQTLFLGFCLGSARWLWVRSGGEPERLKDAVKREVR